MLLCAGPVGSILISALGPTYTLFLAAVFCCVGYGGMALGVSHEFTLDAGGYGAFFFVVSVGSACMYYATLSVNLHNFSPSQTGSATSR